MRFKDRQAVEATMRPTFRAVLVIYAAAPLYLLAVLLYRPSHGRGFMFSWFVTGLTALAALVACTTFDLWRVYVKGRWSSLSPWFSFFQICLGVVVVWAVNRGADPTEALFRPLMALPIVIAAIMGNPTMIAATWLLSMAALVDTAGEITHSAEVTVWELVVNGAFWATLAVVVHVAVAAYLGAVRRREALASPELVSPTRDTSQAVSLRQVLEPVLQRLAEVLGYQRAAVVEVGNEGAREAAVFPPAAERSVADWADGLLEVSPAAGEGKALRVVELPTAEGRYLLIVDFGREEDVLGRPLAKLFRRGMGLDPAELALAVRLVAAVIDQARFVEALANRALSDSLTGLANRRAVEAILRREMARCKRSHEPLCVAVIDLDDFKRFNDTYGHLAGDELLRRFGKKVLERLREQDFIGRWGGEEFVLVMPATYSGGAMVLLESLRAARPASLEDGRGVSFSAGVAQWDGEEDIHRLIARADEALYKAKRSGKDMVVLAEQTMGAAL